jgi:hypothetical protein
MLVKMSSPRNFQRLSWAYAASNNKTLYYLISCLKGFTLHGKTLCHYHAAKKKTEYCRSTSNQVDSHDPRLHISFVVRQHTEHNLTHTYKDQWPSAAWTKVEFCEKFGFRRGLVLLGFRAASLGIRLPTRCPETSVANYPLALQNIPEDRNPKILNTFSNSHSSCFENTAYFLCEMLHTSQDASDH